MDDIEFISKYCKIKDKITDKEISISEEIAKKMVEQMKLLESLKSDKDLSFKYKYNSIRK